MALDNVVLVAHISERGTEQTRRAMGRPGCFRNLQAFLDGHPERMRNLAVRPPPDRVRKKSIFS